MRLPQVLHRLLRTNLDRKQAERALLAYRAALSGPDGEVILDDLCVRFGVFDPRPSATSEEALRREGARRVVIHLMKMAVHPGTSHEILRSSDD